MKAYNEAVPRTWREYPEISRLQKVRDSRIVNEICLAWDLENNPQKVLDLFRRHHENLSDPCYWETLKCVWMVSGRTDNAGEFRRWMKSSRPYRRFFMTPEEEKRLERMSFPLTVYRACSGDDKGISWTISESFANWFQTNYRKERIDRKEVRREDVFAYIDRRGEDEIILL